MDSLLEARGTAVWPLITKVCAKQTHSLFSDRSGKLPSTWDKKTVSCGCCSLQVVLWDNWVSVHAVFLHRQVVCAATSSLVGTGDNTQPALLTLFRGQTYTAHTENLDWQWIHFYLQNCQNTLPLQLSNYLRRDLFVALPSFILFPVSLGYRLSDEQAVLSCHLVLWQLWRTCHPFLTFCTWLTNQ